MANDIVNAQAANTTIKNGTVAVGATGRGSLAANIEVYDDRVLNTPIITDIQDKYDARFDDPRYLAGDTSS